MTIGIHSFRLHRTVFARQFGNDKSMTPEEQLGAVTSECQRVVTAIHEGETIVAAMTGLMERAHSLPEAGKIAFIDASRNMDRRGLHVFLIMTWSCAAGLPMGVIVTSSESETTVAKGLAMLKGIFPEGMYSDGQFVFCFQLPFGFMNQ